MTKEQENRSASPLVVVGSKNPVKMACTRDAFTQAFGKSFTVTGVDASSDIAAQPRSEKETLLGAHNRATHAKILVPEADYWVGIEGGVDEDSQGMYAFAWIYLLHRSGKSSQSKTGTFYLPPQVVALIREGIELGHADDLVFQAQNSKQQGGSVGLLTHGLVTREAYYQQAMVLALIPFLNESLYPAG
ncbi:MAG: inosine/xanthosine triphosphatase [Bacteroidetes bacterium]|nr:inosine/xanthosine triphosphatase [Bacteroidota bacterium]MDA1268384.1 inosine/xanthosine triphosphatase [Bacteroidota bacterium]